MYTDKQTDSLLNKKGKKNNNTSADVKMFTLSVCKAHLNDYETHRLWN